MERRDGWVLGCGDTLIERLFVRENSVRVVLQWVALAVLCAGAIAPWAWVTGVGIVSFCLLGIGVYRTHAYEEAVFEGLPCLTAGGGGTERDKLVGVTVISPARNEEARVEQALRSLCGLTYSRFEVIGIDDHSTDATPEIMDTLAREFANLRVIHDPTPQEGWTGKANAIWKALPEANPEHAWLLFTDADVVFHPKALVRAVAFAQSEGVDLLTFLPYLTNGSFWEDVTLPPIWHSMICGVPYSRLNDEGSYPVGIGAFLLVRRDVYERSGGHAVYPDQHMEDIVIAGLVKECGGKVGVVWTPDLLSIRLYAGLRHLVATSVNKLRVLGRDSLERPLSEASQRALPLLLPLPLSLIAVTRQLVSSNFDVLLSIYAAIGVLTYWENVRSYKAARTTSDMRPWTPWVHPLGGLVRFWIAMRAVFEILVDADSNWRGRKTFIRKDR